MLNKAHARSNPNKKDLPFYSFPLSHFRLFSWPVEIAIEILQERGREGRDCVRENLTGVGGYVLVGSVILKEEGREGAKKGKNEGLIKKSGHSDNQIKKKKWRGHHKLRNPLLAWPWIWPVCQYLQCFGSCVVGP